MTIDWVRRNAILLLLIGLLAGHFAWLASYVAPGYASPDAGGYFAQTRTIANQGGDMDGPRRETGTLLPPQGARSKPIPALTRMSKIPMATPEAAREAMRTPCPDKAPRATTGRG